MAGGGMMMTVRGSVACAPGSVAWVLPHEHLIHSIINNLSSTRQSLGRPEGDARGGDVRPDQLQELRVDPAAVGGINLVMEREDEVLRELELLIKLSPGSGAIVDVTTKREGRDVAKLRSLSDRVARHVVASTSFDLATDASWNDTLSVDEKVERIAKFLETELMFGVGDMQSEGCAGIIYQQIHLAAGSSHDLLTRGLAKAHTCTGAPLFLSISHVHNSTRSSQAEDIYSLISSLIAHGASADRVVLCHADVWSESEDGIRWLAEVARRGVILSFDLIGLYTVSDVVIVNPCLASCQSDAEPPRDSAIACCIAHLIRDGYGGQVLVSSGVQQRIQFQKYGGGGYGHAMHHFKQRLQTKHGLSGPEWDQIVHETPLRLLQWYSPPEAAPIPKHFLKCSICEQYFEPIVGEYFTKFQFTYCGTKCLRKHSRMGFKPLE